jgi:hypothetical protein
MEHTVKRFLIDTSVENAEGAQTWFVDAETEQEALDKFSSGTCALYESNVEVTRCGEPEISGEVPLNDFGAFAEQAPTAQPAPVQDCFWKREGYKECPAAQPAVPDAMTSADIQEHIEYVAGWNECRQAMLEMMK